MVLAEASANHKTPAGMTNPVFKAFTNAVLHCSSLADVTRVLNQAGSK